MVCFFLFGVEVIDSIVEEPFGRERTTSTWIATAGRCASVGAILPSASGPGPGHRPGAGPRVSLLVIPGDLVSVAGL
jgi:hypothetical protein